MNKNKPDLTLSMNDKIYLAVSKRNTDKLAFVYTLACLENPTGSGKYNVVPTREVNTFRDKDAAKLYHDTIMDVIEINSNNELFKIFFETNDKLIERFLENTK